MAASPASEAASSAPVSEHDDLLVLLQAAIEAADLAGLDLVAAHASAAHDAVIAISRGTLN